MSENEEPGQSETQPGSGYRMGVRIDRLERLLERMETGRLSVDRFDFAAFRAESGCGTVGCMGGELPSVFAEWEWAGQMPRLKPEFEGELYRDFCGDVGWFFGIRWEEVRRLFYPRTRNWPDKRLGACLPVEASRTEVAENLRAFIEERKAAGARVRGT